MITDGAEKLEADKDAKNAIIFWILTLMCANKKSFRLGRVDIYFSQSIEAASATNEAKREASLS